MTTARAVIALESVVGPALHTTARQMAAAKFSEWQFERHINSASDLLERAMESRATWLECLRRDFELSQSIGDSDIAIRQDEERCRATMLPDNGPNGYVNGQDVCHAALGLSEAKIRLANRDSLSASIDSSVMAYRTLSNNHAPGVGARSSDERLQADGSLGQCTFSSTQLALELALLPFVVERSNDELLRKRCYAEHARAQLGKIQRAREAGGVFDWTYEASIALMHLQRDYREAIARLLAATKGLSQIFGLEEELILADDAKIADAVCDALTYVRELQRRLALATQYDQGFTVSVAMRDAMGAQWRRFIAGERTDFSVDARLFNGWQYPRLRGLTAEKITRDETNLMMRVFVPARAIRSDGHEFDQSRIPSCFLGRVARRNCGREPEMAGAISLMNICPIPAQNYSWSAQLITPDNGLENLELELSVVGVPTNLAPDPAEVWSD